LRPTARGQVRRRMIRDGMGQSPSATRPAAHRISYHVGAGRRQHRDLQGGCRHPRRPHLGDRQGRQPGVRTGNTGPRDRASTEILAGEGHILTAGGSTRTCISFRPTRSPTPFTRA
jgi:hypothetical protein